MKKKGFTLVEIMVVLAILGAMASMILPRIGSRNSKIKSTVRNLSVLGKQLQNNARLYNKTYRIVFKLPEDEEHSFFVESAEGVQIIANTEEEIEQQEEMEEDADDKEEVATVFTPDLKTLKKPIVLPNPLYFEKIELSSGEITQGEAYVHFFPQGLVEEVAIHITDDENLNWTVTYNTLMGKGHIISSHVSLKDIRGR